ncbi:MAG: hypothetical protein V1907_03600 [Candidatus Kerfeldbacteria bacterium]
MTVYVFGNPDLPGDALPIRLLAGLRKSCPDIAFEVKDPNEEWETPERLVVIDAVVGIDTVQVFSDLATFERTPRVSVHDFDALTQLRLLQKLGRLKKVTIIGVPPTINEIVAHRNIVSILLRLSGGSGIMKERSKTIHQRP